MKVLVIGSGGREHALAWKAAQSPRVEKVFVAPGNMGTALEPKVENVAIGVEDIDALVAFARDNDIAQTIVGPEVPLVLGVVDAFRDAGLRCFGPTRSAAQLEGSKAFTKDFLARHNIPTATYGNFTDTETAVAYIHQQGAPIVIKADGLAAGKGVILAQTEDEAITAVKDMLAGNAFGEAGHRVVIEEFLQGEEASFIVMVDGKHILPLATSQDHKARDEGDLGPNTGGMGAYSPAPVITPALHARIMHEIIEPTVAGMAAEGHPYTGFLYAGVMIAPDGTPKVLEYNCRFGDPETQPIMMRLRSDLVGLIDAALDERLDQVDVDWDPQAALGVVLAAGGYPGDYRRGDDIHGLSNDNADMIPEAKVFHAGTAEKNSSIVTAGGRVLCAVGLGNSVSAAQACAYELVKQIHWDGMVYRRDIGHRAIAREQKQILSTP
ncbi:MAG: phosphoribosylamine--glycine ligase [Gammaproteobacteria bacterium]|nr:phosphoribosylamine--glycine ligase [Gammaproteobacteria bacterium]